MKKLKFLPSILMLVVCIAVLTVGVFASNPTKNPIDGTLSLKGTNQPVEITVTKNGTTVLGTHEVRAGKEYNMLELLGGSLDFNSEDANDLSEVDPIVLSFEITNISDATDTEDRFATETVAAFFTKGTTNLGATELADGTDDVITTDTIIDTATGTAFANVVLDTYTPITPGQTVEMKITFSPIQLYTSDKNGDIDYNLYIEPYQATENYQTANAVLTKLPVAVYEEETGAASLSSLAPLSTTRTLKSGINTIDKDTFTTSDQIQYLAIPSTITTITSGSGSSEGVFSGFSALKSIILPADITEIPDYAFYECTTLTSITIPEGVVSIGNSAFYGCSGLTSITIPSKVTEISNNVFYNCIGLTKITCLFSDVAISPGAFTFCTNLLGVYINNLESWCKASFNSWDSNPLYYAKKLYLNDSLLVNLEIPNTISEIKKYAFENCIYITTISIPNSVSSIGYSSFNGCTGLTEVTIPNSVTTLNSYSFSGCTGIQNITVPGTITSIGKYSFSGCTGLTEVSILDGTENIGYSAFARCENLQKIYWATTISTVEDHVFDECESLNGVYITDINSWCMIDFAGSYSNPLRYAKNLYLNGSLLTDLKIPNTITQIKKYAFEYCTSITSVTIPSSVTEMKENAFVWCTAIKEIYISDIESWCGISFESSDANPMRYSYGCDMYVNEVLLDNLVIPNSVTSINESAFYGCISISNIVIHSDVTNIGSYAFSSCGGLTSITIKSGTDLENAYSLPTNLENPSLTFVGWYANEQGTGDPITEISAEPYSVDTTYYAIWEEN